MTLLPLRSIVSILINTVQLVLHVLGDCKYRIRLHLMSVIELAIGGAVFHCSTTSPTGNLVGSTVIFASTHYALSLITFLPILELLSMIMLVTLLVQIWTPDYRIIHLDDGRYDASFQSRQLAYLRARQQYTSCVAQVRRTARRRERRRQWRFWHATGGGTATFTSEWTVDLAAWQQARLSGDVGGNTRHLKEVHTRIIRPFPRLNIMASWKRHRPAWSLPMTLASTWVTQSPTPQPALSRTSCTKERAFPSKKRKMAAVRRRATLLLGMVSMIPFLQQHSPVSLLPPPSPQPPKPLSPSPPPPKSPPSSPSPPSPPSPPQPSPPLLPSPPSSSPLSPSPPSFSLLPKRMPGSADVCASSLPLALRDEDEDGQWFFTRKRRRDVPERPSSPLPSTTYPPGLGYPPGVLVPRPTSQSLPSPQRPPLPLPSPAIVSSRRSSSISPHRPPSPPSPDTASSRHTSLISSISPLLLVDAPNGDAPIQGLDWVTTTLLLDCDGDEAHQFFDADPRPPSTPYLPSLSLCLLPSPSLLPPLPSQPPSPSPPPPAKTSNATANVHHQPLLPFLPPSQPPPPSSPPRLVTLPSQPHAPPHTLIVNASVDEVKPAGPNHQVGGGGKGSGWSKGSGGANKKWLPVPGSNDGKETVFQHPDYPAESVTVENKRTAKSRDEFLCRQLANLRKQAPDSAGEPTPKRAKTAAEKKLLVHLNQAAASGLSEVRSR